MTKRDSNPRLLYRFPIGKTPGNLLFTHPLKIIEAKSVNDVRSAIQRVEEFVSQGFYAAGFIAYEAAPAFDAAFIVGEGQTNVPLLWFGIFDGPEVVEPGVLNGSYQLGDWTPTVDETTFHEHIGAIQAAIARGETYQVNYTLRLRAPFQGDAIAFFEALHRAQQAKYSAFLDIGGVKILSVSPELFFETTGRRITTRPMKGTIQRGRWPEEDQTYAAALRGSEKDQAENVMIVDLLRNDLGRIAKTGSVKVNTLFDVEAYPTVYQLTSTISAELRDDVGLEGIFSALFPCGSITGAPKVSTMSLIASMESSLRGAYCGAIGLIQPGGDAIFNVAIRTVIIDASGEAEYGVGGGITWDSDPRAEYQEALIKSRVLAADWQAFELLETMLLQDGQYHLLDRHLDRLTASAQYFGVPLDVQSVRDNLRRYANSMGADERRRVRLLVSQNGRVKIEGSPLSVAPEIVQPVALARSPVHKSDRFLYHKTTHRGQYESHRNQHPNVFDVLLWNEVGQLTEFTIGNLVLEIDGEKWTPPRTVGLLAGTLRAELLACGEIRERLLTVEDVNRADCIWLINSVRGWVHVRVVAG